MTRGQKRRLEQARAYYFLASDRLAEMRRTRHQYTERYSAYAVAWCEKEVLVALDMLDLRQQGKSMWMDDFS